MGRSKPGDVHYLVEEHLYKGRIAAGLQAPARELSGRIAWLRRAKAPCRPNSASCWNALG